MRVAVRLFAVLAFGLAAAAGATAPATSGGAMPGPLVRVCYNDQLGPPDGGHFSLQLMRAIVAAKPALRFELQPLPWVRCLILASRGEADAILGASFTPERALDLVYPRDAQGRPDDSRRLFGQGYRLLRRRGDAVDIDGQRFVELVGPIGVERGHSSASFARAGGADTDDNHPDVTAMLAKLRNGRLGGALVAEPQYASLRQQAGALDGLEAAPSVLQPRGYFLVFSASFAQREPILVEQLWNEAARQRETPHIRRETALQQGAALEGDLP
ncbi:ABC transporter substrate-binding protein [Silanimonas sp.]|jgi:polar amino acid transport system substrate-binding protein|uniref:substrate-binding periplasmic protein n=1 Tax=Silanimonas sp. TaxID=1929290 RepID=UPI0022C571D9|nr:transporter substrate-binding domain-containing protein [Silanimonas sp.]MCZ8063613.1 transporter substrate-binding domain-containing protein [Silanimonas sp.]